MLLKPHVATLLVSSIGVNAADEGENAFELTAWGLADQSPSRALAPRRLEKHLAARATRRRPNKYSADLPSSPLP
jgi:hypothetical protein